MVNTVNSFNLWRMALLNTPEFAAAAGVSKAYISQYKKRGIVVLGADGLYDTKELKNSIFLEKQIAKGRVNKKPDDAGTADDAVSSDHDKQQKPTTEKPAPNPELVEYQALEKDKKKTDLEILRMKRDKMRGDVVPTDVVKQAVSRIFTGLLTGLKQGNENFLNEISKRANLSRNDLAELRQELGKILNHCIDEAVDSSKKELNNIVSEYRKDV